MKFLFLSFCFFFTLNAPGQENLAPSTDVFLVPEKPASAVKRPTSRHPLCPTPSFSSNCLGPIQPPHQKTRNVIWDIDETLLHTEFTLLGDKVDPHFLKNNTTTWNDFKKIWGIKSHTCIKNTEILGSNEATLNYFFVSKQNLERKYPHLQHHCDGILFQYLDDPNPENRLFVKSFLRPGMIETLTYCTQNDHKIRMSLYSAGIQVYVNVISLSLSHLVMKRNYSGTIFHKNLSRIHTEFRKGMSIKNPKKHFQMTLEDSFIIVDNRPEAIEPKGDLSIITAPDYDAPQKTDNFFPIFLKALQTVTQGNFKGDWRLYIAQHLSENFYHLFRNKVIAPYLHTHIAQPKP